MDSEKCKDYSTECILLGGVFREPISEHQHDHVWLRQDNRQQQCHSRKPVAPSLRHCIRTVRASFLPMVALQAADLPEDVLGINFPHGSSGGLRTVVAASPIDIAESGSRYVIFHMSHRYGLVVHPRQLSTSCCHDPVAFVYRPVKVSLDREFARALCKPSLTHEYDL